MESLITLTAETLLDPFVFVPALVVAAALVSGLAARLVELLERSPLRTRSRPLARPPAASAATGPRPTVISR